MPTAYDLDQFFDLLRDPGPQRFRRISVLPSVS